MEPVTAQAIETAFREAGIAPLPPAAYQQFVVYLGLLLRWNARLNLTAIREPEEIVRRHLVESAFVAQHLPTEIGNLLDYGSGAGLPGIPIAICRPEIRVTLGEAQGKKASFLREVVRNIGVRSDVSEGRVEALPQERVFDAVTLRAVEKMELAIPVAILHTGLYLILLTTAASAPAYQDLSGEFEWLDPVQLPNADQRILCVGRRRAGS
jgi:16S rRNA (guanine527-N7)-methyltransferase